MIETNAGRIERTRIRPASKKLGKTIHCVIRCSGALHWKGIQDLIQRSGRSRAQGVIRHVDGYGRLWLDQAQPFIGHEEECFICPVVEAWHPNWPAQGTAKIILTCWWLFHLQVIVEPVVRVKCVVPQIVVRRAMPLIRTRLRLKRELTAGVAT